MVTADAVPQAGKDNKEQNGSVYIRYQESDQKQNRIKDRRQQPALQPVHGPLVVLRLDQVLGYKKGCYFLSQMEHDRFTSLAYK